MKRSSPDAQWFEECIPQGTPLQNLWRTETNSRIEAGEPVPFAIAAATALARETDPNFVPRYNPAILHF